MTTDSFRGPQGAVGAQGAQGPKGAQGSQGADGQLRIYGDGSSGNLQILGASSLHTQDPSGTYQFESLSIGPAGSLTVESGAVIRVRGSCSVEGTITVETFAFGGQVGFSGDQTLAPESRSAHPGIAIISAMNGEYGTDAGLLSGANFGSSLLSRESKVLRSSRYGGGGGGGLDGGSGGGAITILCQGTLNISGAIIANGALGSNGSGGGGGGLVVLASAASITNSGTISTNGGNGGSAVASAGPGGGGGGGVVNMIAPAITDTGTVNRAAGTGGSAAATGTVNSSRRFGGGAGGSSGGRGGAGGAVQSDGSTSAGSTGSNGHFNKMEADPTALF